MSKKDVKSLTNRAIAELESMLESADPRVRLRAISLILRHSDKARRFDERHLDIDIDLDKLVKDISKI